MAFIFNRNYLIQHGEGDTIDDFLEALAKNKNYIITLINNKKYEGKINRNNPDTKIIEIKSDDDVGEMRIPYDHISTIKHASYSGGGKRINYSTKKSKNRRHASRRRRTTKKHSGRIKHSRRRRA